MNISLSKFSKNTGLAKTSVYRRCQELGIDTSAGLDEGAIALLCEDFDVSLDDEGADEDPLLVASQFLEVANQLTSTMKQFLEVADRLTDAIKQAIEQDAS